MVRSRAGSKDPPPPASRASHIPSPAFGSHARIKQRNRALWAQTTPRVVFPCTASPPPESVSSTPPCRASPDPHPDLPQPTDQERSFERSQRRRLSFQKVVESLDLCDGGRPASDQGPRRAAVFDELRRPLPGGPARPRTGSTRSWNPPPRRSELLSNRSASAVTRSSSTAGRTSVAPPSHEQNKHDNIRGDWEDEEDVFTPRFSAFASKPQVGASLANPQQAKQASTPSYVPVRQQTNDDDWEDDGNDEVHDGHVSHTRLEREGTSTKATSRPTGPLSEHQDANTSAAGVNEGSWEEDEVVVPSTKAGGRKGQKAKTLKGGKARTTAASSKKLPPPAQPTPTSAASAHPPPAAPAAQRPDYVHLTRNQIKTSEASPPGEGQINPRVTHGGADITSGPITAPKPALNDSLPLPAKQVAHAAPAGPPAPTNLDEGGSWEEDPSSSEQKMLAKAKQGKRSPLRPSKKSAVGLSRHKPALKHAEEEDGSKNREDEEKEEEEAVPQRKASTSSTQSPIQSVEKPSTRTQTSELPDKAQADDMWEEESIASDRQPHPTATSKKGKRTQALSRASSILPQVKTGSERGEDSASAEHQVGKSGQIESDRSAAIEPADATQKTCNEKSQVPPRNAVLSEAATKLPEAIPTTPEPKPPETGRLPAHAKAQGLSTSKPPPSKTRPTNHRSSGHLRKAGPTTTPQIGPQAGAGSKSQNPLPSTTGRDNDASTSGGAGHTNHPSMHPRKSANNLARVKSHLSMQPYHHPAQPRKPRPRAATKPVMFAVGGEDSGSDASDNEWDEVQKKEPTVQPTATSPPPAATTSPEPPPAPPAKPAPPATKAPPTAVETTLRKNDTQAWSDDEAPAPKAKPKKGKAKGKAKGRATKGRKAQADDEGAWASDTTDESVKRERRVAAYRAARKANEDELFRKRPVPTLPRSRSAADVTNLEQAIDKADGSHLTGGLSSIFHAPPSKPKPEAAAPVRASIPKLSHQSATDLRSLLGSGLRMSRAAPPAKVKSPSTSPPPKTEGGGGKLKPSKSGLALPMLNVAKSQRSDHNLSSDVVVEPETKPPPPSPLPDIRALASSLPRLPLLRQLRSASAVPTLEGQTDAAGSLPSEQSRAVSMLENLATTSHVPPRRPRGQRAKSFAHYTEQTEPQSPPPAEDVASQWQAQLQPADKVAKRSSMPNPPRPHSSLSANAEAQAQVLASDSSQTASPEPMHGPDGKKDAPWKSPLQEWERSRNQDQARPQPPPRGPPPRPNPSELLAPRKPSDYGRREPTTATQPQRDSQRTLPSRETGAGAPPAPSRPPMLGAGSALRPLTSVRQPRPPISPLTGFGPMTTLTGDAPPRTARLPQHPSAPDLLLLQTTGAGNQTGNHAGNQRGAGGAAGGGAGWAPHHPAAPRPAFGYDGPALASSSESESDEDAPLPARRSQSRSNLAAGYHVSGW